MTSIFETKPSTLNSDLVAAVNALPVKNAETMAKAVYAVLCKAAGEEGQNAKIEVAIKRPATCWCVVWEAGPYEWAISASMALTGTGKLVEPYYSFDLCFYPSED